MEVTLPAGRSLAPADLEIYARIGRELKMYKQNVDVSKLVWK